MQITKTTPTKSILVVDNDVEIRDVVREALHDHFKVTIVEAKGGHEALQLLKKTNFNLIISDLAMPDGDGLQVFFHLKKCPSLNTSFILFSGSTVASELNNVMTVVQKPNFPELLNTVKSLRIL